jgi:carboxyl-terminal processing protease
MEELNNLINDNKIPEWVAANSRATAAEADAFARRINAEYHLDTGLVKRLIRNEQNRTVIAPVYDLEYDVQLQEAVRIIKEGDFKALMQTAKTLKALQEEAEQDEELAKAS